MADAPRTNGGLPPPPRGPQSAPDAVGPLLAGIDTLAEEVADRIVQDDEFYLETTLIPHHRMIEVCRANLQAILTELQGGGPPSTGAAVETGRVQARFGVPVEAILQAYRIGGRVVWERLVQDAGDRPNPGLVQLASRVWDLVDRFSDTAAQSYRETEWLQTRLDPNARETLLDSLFVGGAGESVRVWDGLRALDMPESGAFLVVYAEIGPNGKEPLPDIAARLRRAGVHSVWSSAPERQAGLLSLPSAQDTEAVDQCLGRSVARIGVSPLFPRPTGTHQAFEAAKLAARCLPPGAAGVVHHDDMPIRLMLARIPEGREKIARQVLGPLLNTRPATRASLIETLNAYFECKGSSSAVADRLNFHRNTVRYRLRRVEELTGRSVSEPIGSCELYVALQAVVLGAGYQI